MSSRPQEVLLNLQYSNTLTQVTSYTYIVRTYKQDIEKYTRYVCIVIAIACVELKVIVYNMFLPAITDGVVAGMNKLDIAGNKLSLSRVPTSSAAMLLKPSAAVAGIVSLSHTHTHTHKKNTYFYST